jgi:hypothetical protein
MIDMPEKVCLLSANIGAPVDYAKRSDSLIAGFM